MPYILKTVHSPPTAIYRRYYTKRIPLLSKMVYKLVRFGPRGGASPYKTLLSIPGGKGAWLSDYALKIVC